MTFLLSSSSPTGDQRSKLKQDIKCLERQIAENESMFNMIDSEDLIEYSIYENNALRAKHCYLIKCFKKIP